MDSDANKQLPAQDQPEEDINLEVPVDSSADLTIKPDSPIKSDENNDSLFNNNSDNEIENEAVDYPAFQEQPLNDSSLKKKTNKSKRTVKNHYTIKNVNNLINKISRNFTELKKTLKIVIRKPTKSIKIKTKRIAEEE